MPKAVNVQEVRAARPIAKPYPRVQYVPEKESKQVRSTDLLLKDNCEPKKKPPACVRL